MYLEKVRERLAPFDGSRGGEYNHGRLHSYHFIPFVCLPVGENKKVAHFVAGLGLGLLVAGFTYSVGKSTLNLVRSLRGLRRVFQLNSEMSAYGLQKHQGVKKARRFFAFEALRQVSGMAIKVALVASLILLGVGLFVHPAVAIAGLAGVVASAALLAIYCLTRMGRGHRAREVGNKLDDLEIKMNNVGVHQIHEGRNYSRQPGYQQMPPHYFPQGPQTFVYPQMPIQPYSKDMG